VRVDSRPPSKSMIKNPSHNKGTSQSVTPESVHLGENLVITIHGDYRGDQGGGQSVDQGQPILNPCFVCDEFDHPAQRCKHLQKALDSVGKKLKKHISRPCSNWLRKWTFVHRKEDGWTLNQFPVYLERYHNNRDYHRIQGEELIEPAPLIKRENDKMDRPKERETVPLELQPDQSRTEKQKAKKQKLAGKTAQTEKPPPPKKGEEWNENRAGNALPQNMGGSSLVAKSI